ncbi:TonB-dependent receptor [Pseudohaliea sp.]|uniref:TonB-dependent receptor n=1 Tax=Pseudohaliea sp. TaxID=2740289 RepID=UPI0032EC8BC0
MSQPVLEEVIVTAQKREQSLQDVPVAVTAFSGERLQESGVRDFFEVSNIDPALSVGKSQTSTATSFSIRGVFTSSQNFGLESSVGLYVDGVYRARQSAMINNLVDVASVEILRGPQGTLFGRNTPSGAVSLNSRKPDFDGEGYLEASGGDLDLFSIDGAKSITLIDDELAIRATGFYMERDGYIDVLDLGDEVLEDRDRWGGRLQALWLPTDDLSIHLIADYSEIDEVCCAAGNYVNNLQAQQLPPGAAPVFGTDNNVLAAGGTVIDQDRFFDYEVASSFLPTSQNEDKGLSLQVDWALPAFDLTSITAYREFDSYDEIDADFYDIDALIRSNDARQSQFSQELRIAGTTEKLTYVGGLFYFEQELDLQADTIVGEDTGQLVGVPAALFPAGGLARNVSAQDNKAYAAFGQIDYNLTDSLVLTGGLRWTREQKDMQNFFTEINPGIGFAFFPPLAPRDDVDEDIDDDQVTGTAKVSWFAREDMMFYVSYGTGYKAGGVNTDRIQQSLNVVFDAEESQSWEVGMKAEFPEQALRVNLALHRTETDDLQTISFQGTGFALQNAGVAEAQGGELDLLWQPLDNTTVTLGYAYNDAEYDDFEAGDCWIGTPFHTGQPDPRANGDGSCDRSGGLLSGNPEHTMVTSLRQDFALSSNLTAFLYGEYIWIDERMTDVNNDPLKLADDYSIINLRAGLILEDWDVQITAWGRNVGDEDYTNTIADAVAQPGRMIAYFNEPATWGINVRKNFR